ncbi:MAG: OmpA family protein, partial [Myxococcota bacterium]
FTLTSKVELPSPIEYPGLVSVNGHTIAPGEGRMSIRAPIDASGILRIDVRQPNGRRGSVVSSAPFDSTQSTSAAPVAISVAGNLDEGQLSFGDVPTPIELFTSQCQARPEDYRIEERRVVPPVQFELQGANPSTWTVRVFNPDGTVLTDLKGTGGSATQTIRWDGTNASGNPVAKAGSYGFRCLLSDESGAQFAGPLHYVALESPSSGGGDATTLHNHVLSGKAFPNPDRLQSSVRDELRRVSEKLKATAAAQLTVEVHENSTGGRVQAQMRTVRVAAALKDALIALGVKQSQVELRPLGANQPVMPGSSRVAAQRNRRVVLTVLAPSKANEGVATPKVESTAPRARIAGRELTVDEEGGFSDSITAEPDGTVSVELLGRDGRRWVGTIALRAGRPQATRPVSTRPVEALGSQPADLLVSASVPNGVPSDESSSRLSPTGSGTGRAVRESGGRWIIPREIGSTGVSAPARSDAAGEQVG